MHGFIRGLRQLFFITALFAQSTIIFTSCSVFRTLGLYNVPPPYSESYEEYHGSPLLHLNKAENISMHLSSDKKSYYPGEPITLICTVKNLSESDTMGVNSPFNSQPYIQFNNSSGNIVHYHGPQAWGNPVIIVDEYGRRLNVTYQKQVAPNSQIEFKRRITRYYNNSYKIWSKDKVGEILERAYDFNIYDLIPDVYTINCFVNHTYFDEIKGPLSIRLNSDTLQFEIKKPTDTQIIQREEYIQIIDSIMELDDLDDIYMKANIYEKTYPEGFYLIKLKKYVLDREKLRSLLGYIKNYKETGRL